jgi:hypothetical protein
MGAAASAVRRRLMRFNIEERAFKIMDAEKPKPAPHHETTEKLEVVARQSTYAVIPRIFADALRYLVSLNLHHIHNSS